MLRHAFLALLLVGLTAVGAASAAFLGPAGTTPATSTACGVVTPLPVSTVPGSVATAPTQTSALAGVSVPATTTAPPGTTSPAVGAGSPAGGCPAAASAGSSVAGTTTPPPPTGVQPYAGMLVLSGHGFGHGMGMGQWGAYGYALHGWSATAILGHYYRGTTLGTVPGTTVRVLVSGPDHRVRLGSDAPWRVVDGAGTSLMLPAGTIVVSPGLVLDGHQLVSPLTFSGHQPLAVGKRTYRGKLVLVVRGGHEDVVDTVGLESYLDGVVGAEMPASWPAAALEAQAIAARSYALSLLDDVATVEPFDLYGDSRSQVYGGVQAESTATTSAVEATAHEVLLYQGQVARAYYSASTGGETASAAEVLGTAVPYLVSVTDPYDRLSPYHDWGPVEIGVAAAGRALGLQGPLLSLQAAPAASQHVDEVTAIGANGQVTLSGTQVAADLGLQSTWFEVGWLWLDPPAAPVALGSDVPLAGAASGLGSVELESRLPGGTWLALEPVAPSASGAFSVSVTPSQTTRYRLSAGGALGAVVTVAVAATVDATIGSGEVTGSVSPALAGEAVVLQRADGPRWDTVVSGTTAPGGGFRIAAPLTPGTYRVRADPGGGLRPGFSLPLTAAAPAQLPASSSSSSGT